MSALRKNLAAYAFLAPLLVTLLIFFAYGLVRTVFYGFTHFDFFHPAVWVGLSNYAELFHKTLFLDALRNTVIYAVGTTIVQTVIALLLAVALNNKIQGRSFFRTAFYLPSITSSVVVTLIFTLLFRETGTFNFIITEFLTYLPHIILLLVVMAIAQAVQVSFERRRGLPAGAFDPMLLGSSLIVAIIVLVLAIGFGFIGPRAVGTVRIPWLTTTQTILGPLHVPLPLLAIMLLNIWTTAPTFMIYFLAGLQDIPRSLYEAASIDGANSWQQLRYVTIPSLRPVLFLVLTLSIIGTLALFDQVAILQGTSPLQSTITLAYYVYSAIFPSGRLPEVGLASAAAVFLAILTLVAVFINRLLVSSEAQ